MHRGFMITGALLLALAVGLGAFGAHGLKQMLDDKYVSTFETGVRYHFYHAFALLLAALAYERLGSRRLLYAGYCFIAGIVLFSGSLYLLTFLKATNTVGLTGIGIITPFGGLFFIAGWLLFAASAAGKNRAL